VTAVLKDNPTCYTGKAMFANDHPYGDNTLDNLVTDALTADVFDAALVAAGEWKFANGVLVRPTFTHLLHGPKLRKTAFAIVDAPEISAGVANPNYKKCIRVELPDLAGDYDDYWTLVDASQPVKAIVRQIREVPVPTMNDAADIEENGELKWMSHGRAAAAPTFPHLVYGGRL